MKNKVSEIKPAIFVRSYSGDFCWLKYCLRSIAKHAPDVPTLVVAPDFAGFDCAPRPNLEFRFCQVRHPRGYVDQQISKVFADSEIAQVFPETTHIVHIDSDTVLTGPVDPLFRDGKPCLLRTPYSELPSDARAWQRITEKHLGFDNISHEYMRRMGLAYPVSLYAELRRHLASLHGGWQSWIDSIQGHEFSEFNALGAFAHEHPKFHDDFVWVDTDKQDLPPLIVKQHWSWGGIDAHRAELEKLFP